MLYRDDTRQNEGARFASKPHKHLRVVVLMLYIVVSFVFILVMASAVQPAKIPPTSAPEVNRPTEVSVFTRSGCPGWRIVTTCQHTSLIGRPYRRYTAVQAWARDEETARAQFVEHMPATCVITEQIPLDSHNRRHNKIRNISQPGC